MNKRNIIIGLLGAVGFFAAGTMISPVVAHYSGANNGNSVVRGEGYGLRQQERSIYKDCPMHEKYQRRGMERNSFERNGGGYHRGMMERF
jgi:hypothetical protein